MEASSLLTRGRPRDSRVDSAIRDAVLELLATSGYAGTTIDRITAQAGVGKAALYRRWQSKAELVFAVVVHPIALGPPPDTGSLEGDLTAVAAIVRDRLSNATAAAALAALAAELLSAPEIADALDERLFAEERRWLEEILTRARARGELRTGPVEPSLVRQAVIGPIALAVLFSPGAPVPTANAVAGLVAHGLSP